ncbi:MAG: hypothetical protein FWC93_03510 [Defluviitaleaceae bacterium]|nr:hypothetical protein [Defluviitaleaceae bacterium]
MKKIKRISALAFVLILIFSVIPTHTVDGRGGELIFERVVVDEEIVYVAEGIPVLFTVYSYNGMLVETATLMEETSDGYSAISSDTRAARSQSLLEIEDLAYIVAAVSDERYIANSSSGWMQESSSGNHEASGFMHRTNRSPTNASVIVEHSFAYHAVSNVWMLGHQTMLTLSGGTVRGHNSVAGNAETIRLEQNISRDGMAVSVSFPWGIAFSGNSTTEHWSITERNTFMVTARWPRNFTGSWPLAFFWNRTLVTITSRVDVSTRTGGAITVDAAVITHNINIW